MNLKSRLTGLKIQYRITLSIFAILIILGIPCAIILLNLQHQGNIRQFQVSATTLASTIENSLHQFMQTNQPVQIQNTIAKIANDNDNIHRVQVFASTGRITASSNLFEVGQYKPKDCIHIQQVLEEGKILAPVVDTAGETNEECESTTDFRVMYPILNSPECYTCHGEEERVLGVLDINIDKSILQEQRHQMILFLGLSGGLTFIFIGLATVFTLRLAVLKPFSQRFADMEKERNEQQKLYLASRLASIGELASGIAHELNNPLTSVIGFSELLMDKDIPEDIKDDLKVINTEAQRTAMIVKNLLSFAREHPAAKQPIDINDVIRAVLDLRAYEEEIRNIRVVTNLRPDLPKVMADPYQLQQVFMNIIINAESFMIEAHGRGTLTVNSEANGNNIRVSISDDGPGIEPDVLEKIFDPFFTTKDVGKGTGLGLSICHGIISEHDGKISVESKKDQGTTFIIELPELSNQ